MTATARIDAAGNSSVPDMAEAIPSGVCPETADRVFITVATTALPSTEHTYRVAL